MTKEEAKKFGLHLLQGIMERNESYPVYANNVKQAIDALSEQSGSSEIPNDLEEAARHSEILTYPMPEDGDIEKVFKVQETRVFHEIGFIAGAKWQAEHAPLPEDTVLFNKGVEEGKRLMMEEFEGNRLAACDSQTKEEYDRETDFVDSIIKKEHRQPTFSDAINYGMRLQKEQMMEEAVEGYVNYYEDSGGILMAEAQVGFPYHNGDKVRMIVLPKEDNNE